MMTPTGSRLLTMALISLVLITTISSAAATSCPDSIASKCTQKCMEGPDEEDADQCPTCHVDQHGQAQCRCPPGYSGDALAEGSGCIKEGSKKKSGEPDIHPVVLAVGVTVLLVAVAYVVWLILKRRYWKQDGDLESNTSRQARQYEYWELVKATGDFTRRIRVDGRSYKGTLGDQECVVKKLPQTKPGPDQDVITQRMRMVCLVHHANVVRALGTCVSKDVPMVVYQYVPNVGFLRMKGPVGNKGRMVKLWPTRLQIAIDIATAVHHLHEGYDGPIVHKCLKSKNIVIDKDMRPVIVNFGFSLARVSRGLVETDVWAFGILLCELVTGRVVDSSAAAYELHNLVVSTSENEMPPLFDPQIEQGNVAQLTKTLTAAKVCFNPDPKQNRGMDFVVKVLKTIERVLAAAN